MVELLAQGALLDVGEGSVWADRQRGHVAVAGRPQVRRVERREVAARGPDADNHQRPSTIGPPARELIDHLRQIGRLLIEAPEAGWQAAESAQQVRWERVDLGDERPGAGYQL